MTIPKHWCIFFSYCSFSFYLSLLPWKSYDEIVQNKIWDSAYRWDSPVGKHSVTGENKISTSNIVAKEATRPKLGGCWVAGVHEGEKTGRCCTTHTIWTWDIRSMNQGKLEIVKQEMKQLHIAMLGVSKLNWTELRRCPVTQLQVVHSGNDKLGISVALMLRSCSTVS